MIRRYHIMHIIAAEDSLAAADTTRSGSSAIPPRIVSATCSTPQRRLAEDFVGELGIVHPYLSIK